MAFGPPTLELPVKLWRGGGAGGAYATPDATFNATLSLGRRDLAKAAPGLTPTAFPQFYAELLCGKGQDVRAVWNNTAGDLVEVPAGTKRFYDVVWVDDVGKGFNNEYRLVLMLMRTNATGAGTAFGFAFPVPLP